jgi:pilus assembly protein CpaD
LRDFVCACNTDQQVAAVPDVPTDYRLRHPITISEADHTLEVFIGSDRGEPQRASQRAEVMALAQTWKHEATGGVVVDLPVGTSNERAAAEAHAHDPLAPGRRRRAAERRAGARLPSAGDQPRDHPHHLSENRRGQAGPCGIWPEDIGPSFNRDYFENQPVYNFGCASQRNLAADGRQSGRPGAAARRDAGL